MSVPRGQLVGLLALLALGAAGKEAAPRGRAPWREVEIRTPGDAERAWALVRSTFGELRAGHAHEVWARNRADMPPARPIEACLAALEAEGRPWPRVDRGCHVSGQVRADREIEGVRIGGRMSATEPDLVVGCELAARLPRVARVLHELGVRRIEVGPPARASARSFHRFGLAFDVYELELESGAVLVVERDFERQPDRATCEGPAPARPEARALREIACRLHEARALTTVITPNYNEGHHDHFHWDVRPGDERFYLR